MPTATDTIWIGRSAALSGEVNGPGGVLMGPEHRRGAPGGRSAHLAIGRAPDSMVRWPVHSPSTTTSAPPQWSNPQ